MESKVVTSSSPSNFQLGEKVLTSNTTKILYHMASYGPSFVVWFVLHHLRGFTNGLWLSVLLRHIIT